MRLEQNIEMYWGTRYSWQLLCVGGSDHNLKEQTKGECRKLRRKQG